jgi:phage N-6-adenine-methyltransferase
VEPQALSFTESEALAAYERTIAEGLETFVVVGQALLAIRDQRLYRMQYLTFEEYCRERWELSRPYAYQLMDAATVVHHVSAVADILPANEAQARPLAALRPDEQGQVWRRALETAPNGRLTAAYVQAVVAAHTAPSAATPCVRTQFTGEQEWYTPPLYIDATKQVLGAIDLDPASSHPAQATVQATAFYTAEDDGLSRPWEGRVWLNAPYAQPLQEHFVDKLIREFTERRVLAAIMLSHNYTDTAWFHKAEAVAQRLCFTRGRIKFLDPHGHRTSPPQGQVFFDFGPDPDRFTVIFGEFGFIHSNLHQPVMRRLEG